MRTTITLDPDTAAKVKAEMRRTGHSFKQVVNGLLRRAPDPAKSTPELKPFKVKARALGERPEYSFDNIGELLDRLDAEERK
jgi:hypothetical protein